MIQNYYLQLLFSKSGGNEQVFLNDVSELFHENPLREWCDNQSRRFDDKKFSDLFYEQLESSAKKLSNFAKKIGKNIEDLEIDDLVLLVEKR